MWCNIFHKVKQEISFFSFQIYEGINENAPKAGRWCGSQIPPAHESLTNELLILFHTDWSFNAEGFRIKYETGLWKKDENCSSKSFLLMRLNDSSLRW